MADRGSTSDQLAKLADLRQRGALSDQEFEGQKRLVLDAAQQRSVRHRGALAVFAVAAVVVAVAFLGMSTTRPSRTGGDAGPVQISTVALTQSQVQTAINYAMTQVGHSTYNQLCLQLVSDAYAHAGISIGSSSDPVTYWAANPRGYTEHSARYGPYGSPPAGAILFWGQTKWSSDGHAAISLGNGTVVSSAAYPYADGPSNGEVFALSSRNPSTYHYLGYLLPGTLTTTSSPPPAVAAPPAAPPAANPTTAPPAATAPRPSGNSQTTTVGSQQPVSGAPAPQSSGSPAQTTGTSSTQTASASPTGSSASPTPTPIVSTSTPTPSQPAPQPVAQPAPTFSETVGGVSHTWTNYSNAGGVEGQSIASNQTVQISCKLTGFTVADGNTWWYRIASSPWNNGYYVSADAFYNNGATSGSLHGHRSSIQRYPTAEPARITRSGSIFDTRIFSDPTEFTLNRLARAAAQPPPEAWPA